MLNKPKNAVNPMGEGEGVPNPMSCSCFGELRSLFTLLIFNGYCVGFLLSMAMIYIGGMMGQADIFASNGQEISVGAKVCAGTGVISQVFMVFFVWKQKFSHGGPLSSFLSFRRDENFDVKKQTEMNDPYVHAVILGTAALLFSIAAIGFFWWHTAGGTVGDACGGRVLVLFGTFLGLGAAINMYRMNGSLLKPFCQEGYEWKRPSDYHYPFNATGRDLYVLQKWEEKYHTATGKKLRHPQSVKEPKQQKTVAQESHKCTKSTIKGGKTAAPEGSKPRDLNFAYHKRGLFRRSENNFEATPGFLPPSSQKRTSFQDLTEELVLPEPSMTNNHIDLEPENLVLPDLEPSDESTSESYGSTPSGSTLSLSYTYSAL